MVTSQKPKITARIHKKLQPTVAAVCLDIVYKMGDSMKKIEMYNRVFKLYHGSNDGEYCIHICV